MKMLLSEQYWDKLSTCESEKDRLNQHIKDLMGQQVQAQNTERGRLTPVESAALRQLWIEWSALADNYEKLAYENRANDSTKFPFDPGSWPEEGQPCTETQVSLYGWHLYAKNLSSFTDDMMKAFGWTDRIGPPRVEKTVLIIDFIRESREFQYYLDWKKKELGS
jgi:hypothetical protein